MASRLLTQLLTLGATALASATVLGCPHDWAAFESVPRDTTDQGDSEAPSVPSDGRDSSVPEAAPAETATFAAMQEKPSVLAADAAGIVFLTLEGSVLACSHDGCALPTAIASSQHDPRALAIGYGFVAWTARGDNAVRRASRTPGHGPALQATDNQGVGALGLSPTKVYFAVDAVNDLIRGAGIRMCSPGIDCNFASYDGFADGRVTEMKVDGADAFWLGENRLVGCPTAACDDDMAKRVVLAEAAVLPFALAVDVDNVYFGSPLDGGSIRAVARTALAGNPGAGPRVVVKGVGTPARLAVTPSSVWFTDPSGIVSRAPRSGGPAVVVATGLSQPTGIAVGGGWVYVACAGDGRILRWKQD
jgi:hypothetical protein